MAIIINLKNLSALQDEIGLALGFFDGYHKGHQRIIEAVSLRPAAVFTFSNHPKTILNSEKAPAQITTFDEKLALLNNDSRIDFIIWSEFTENMLNLSPERFIESVIVEKLKAKHIFIGYNYRFGKNGAGDAELLYSYGMKFGFQTEKISPVSYEKTPISSTQIRQFIKKGHMEMAEQLLGRPYAITSLAILKPDENTLKLSKPERKILPPDGIYKGSINGRQSIFSLEDTESGIIIKTEENLKNPAQNVNIAIKSKLNVII